MVSLISRSKLSFKRGLNLILMILGIIVIMTPISSAQTISIIATVDGTPISNIDFEQRRNFLVKTTGIQYTEQTKEQIDGDVIQMLIDDVIKVNAGNRLSGATEDIIMQRAEDLVDISFSQHGGNANEVLKSLGIPRNVAVKKFAADVLWASAIQVRFAQQFAETRLEAEQELERIKSNIKKPQINLDEIVLAPEPNRNFTATKRLGNQIFKALEEGAEFSRIAQQYSITGSARQGGALGWLPKERIPQNVLSALNEVPIGAFSKPLEIDGAIVIYRVNGIREDGRPSPVEDEVSLMRLILPVDTTNVSGAQEQIKKDLQKVKECRDLEKLHQQYGTSLPARLGNFKVSALAPQLREAIINLNANEYTDPINFSDGLMVIMVCERIKPQISLPSLEVIENSIRDKHFSDLSARYLSRLRKQATIDYKGNS